MSEKENLGTPEKTNPASPRNSYGDYGYSYNGYAYSSGMADAAGGLSETIQNRTIGDYITIFRERIWYLILSVFIVLSGVLVYTYNIVPEYTASGRVQVLRQAINLGGPNAMRDVQIGGQDDFLTQVEIMTSEQIINRVVQRLTQAELSEVVDPYKDSDFFSGPLSAEEVIARYRSVTPKKSTFIVTIGYTHRTKEIAKKMTDYFIDEICKYNTEIRAVRINPAIETTQQKIESLEEKIEAERKERVNLVKREGLLELDMGTAAQELSSINSQLDLEKKNYEDQLAVLTEIDKAKKEGASLLEQPAIVANQHVSSLLSRRAELRITISSMLERYAERHPELIRSREQLLATEKELEKAVQKAEAEFNANFIAAQRRYESAKRRAIEKTAKLQKMREASTQLEALTAQLKNDEELLQRLRINLEDQNLSLTTTSTSIIQPLDSASVPSMPSNKNFILNSLFAIVAGIALGSGVIILLSFLDDRIKSIKDVELSLGLPLLASVSRIGSSKKKLVDRATIVSTGDNRGVVESFISLYSALKIGEVSKTAKVIAVTSTTPSEGKTFISSNVAQVYANHGENVLLLDADLRLPNVARSLGMDPQTVKGIKSYIDGEVTLDEAIVKDFKPGLDVLPVGDSVQNPTRIINGKKFLEMIQILRERYDRIIIDTPPIAAVSDILNILPNCDGVIFTIKFNTVQRMLVKNSLRRLEEAKVPIFGVVLNQMPHHTGHYYTNKSYSNSYSNYYSRRAD